MGLVLFIVSMLLFVVLVPIGIVWSIVGAFWKRGFVGGLLKIDDMFLNIAVAIDVFGNTSAKELFNGILIKENGYKFGRPRETISSVLGKNYRDKTLTKVGKLLRDILHKLDPNHSINAIQS